MAKCKDTKKLNSEVNKAKKSTSRLTGKGFTVMVIKDVVSIAGKTYKYGDKLKVETTDGLIGLVTKLK